MKLLVVSSWLPDPLGNGSQIRAYQLLRQLSRRHILTLLALGTPRVPEAVGALHDMCKAVEVVPATRLLGNRLGARELLSPVPRYYAQTASPRMAALVAQHVHDHDLAVGLQATAARYLREYRDRPRVFEEAEVAVFLERCRQEADRVKRWRHRLTWLKFKHFTRRLVNDFEQTTVVSAQERDHLVTIGCDVDRISIVPNGVAVRATSPSRVFQQRLIYPGSVTYSANLDAVRFFIREILPAIRRSLPNVVFMVTGSTDGAEISDLVSQNGVTFTGQLPAVDDLIAESAACVVPLRIGGGTRLKVLHAMALGTPVVSTTKGIEGLDVEPGRHVLTADSPQSFANQVLHLLGDTAAQERLAREAQSVARDRYSWEGSGDALELAIRQAVRESAVSGRSVKESRPIR